MADDDGIPIEQILAELDIPRYDAEDLEGAAIVDAIVIFRYQAPDWPTPRLTYVKSRGMGDELTVGCITNVVDHMPSLILAGWDNDA